MHFFFSLFRNQKKASSLIKLERTKPFETLESLEKKLRSVDHQIHFTIREIFQAQLVRVRLGFTKQVNILDLGCGTGRLAIGAAILGAEVTGYEIDEEALEQAEKYSNEHKLSIKWSNKAIENIEEKYDTTIMNPPFGSQRPGADKIFLEKA